MSKRELAQLQRRRPALSVRVSMWLVFAALFPLLITVVFSEWESRPALTAQASVAMESDAKTRVQLIDTYLSERLLDIQTLTQIPSVQAFLTASPGPGYQDLATHAAYALVAGRFRDKHYTVWSLFDPKGKPLLYYPSVPQPHGQYLMPPEDLQAVLSGKTFISAVYYSPATQKASVDIYSPIVTPPTAQPANTFLGFIRATLNLDYVWNIVNENRGNNGPGSYAFVLDENGVRIADTETTRRFTAITPLAPLVEQNIRQEERYGSTTSVPILRDNTLAERVRDIPPSSHPTTFQMEPTGQSEQFQVVQYTTSVVPWTYFVLSPVSTVTDVANKQLLVTVLVASAMFVLAVVIGLLVGRGITHPILSSVDYLRNSSQALSELASRQKDASSEQMWVVDSSLIGLQSVQYYTDATQVAARQLSDIGKDLALHWYQVDAQTAMQRLERIVRAAQYIENAARYQRTSNQRLATALKVATQVTEQLATGATSANEAATQLEQVVKQLRYVVGK